MEKFGAVVTFIITFFIGLAIMPYVAVLELCGL